MKDQQYINIERANENNLKNVSIKIPHHKITCVTGVSGSGKSSLVYDIICKESQRRYLESFSSYARQFFGKTSRPEVEKIEGLMPAISVDQKTVSKNPRSTVGTMSELYDYLRLLFARLGKKSSDEDIKINRSLFSFNSPEGACPHCKGLGVEDMIDPELLIEDENKSLREGALKITTPSGYTIYSQVTIDVMQQVCESEGFNVDIPWKDLTDDQKHIILNGSNKIKIPYGKHTLESRMKWSGITAKPREEGFYKGILPVMENILRVDRNPNILRFARTVECSQCKGKRLNPQALSVLFDNKNIAELADYSIQDIHKYFSKLKFNDAEKSVGELLQEKIIERCEVMLDLGLAYLTLSRESTTLSGGEAQRIRLATQVGNGLRGIMYILDEPSIGLHPRDNQRMINILKKLRDQGNTVLVVEHDKETMLCADELIDIGPLAGKNGGEVLFQSAVDNVDQLQNQKSKTLEYLQKSEINKERYDGTAEEWLEIKGARLHNLKNIDARFKRHSLNVVTGVSGAGKSSLVMQVLGDSLIKKINKEKFEKNYDEIVGAGDIAKVIEIDQTPIGRTPRSNPATFVKVFDLIRKLFADLPESKEKGWKQGHFSFNTKGGRCETCEGGGVIQTGMHFLGNVETVCETCNGKRFDDDTLAIKYKGRSISDILNLEISDAVEFFKDEPKIHHYLKIMQELGLGYIHLGQSATTLSGGEAQRLKLAAELVKPTKKHTLYIFDEPTTGLHAYDVRILLEALNRLCESGHTVIVIEHHEDIIRNASHVVDLGPEGGELGGNILFAGSPEKLLECEGSFTAKALREDRKKDEQTKELFDDKVISAPIELKGVNTHNLKDIDVEIPRNKLTVITGVSGSGKSSLAFDTLFAEGQRRFTESFSTYARRMIQQKARPDVRESHGLTPTIAINGRSVTRHPRATVGTVTGIYDLYRLLFSRISKHKAKENPLSNYFSFNHEAGACSHCKGLGNILVGDPQKIVTNPELSLLDGALKGSKPGKFYGDPFGQYVSILKAVGAAKGIDYSKAWNDLNDEEKQIAMYGDRENQYEVKWEFKRKNRTGTHEFKTKWAGFIWYIEDEYQRKHESDKSKVLIDLMKEIPCPECSGARLNKEVLEYKVDRKNIYEISKLEAKSAYLFFKGLKESLSIKEAAESSELILSIMERLQHMEEIGLGYLHMHRSTMTLSGGEARRLRLIAQLGGELTGITYVMDEPTIGLHSSDTKNLICLLKKLSEDNTVVVVEHDEEVIQEAEHLIEVGSGAGELGGEIIARGSFKEVLNNKNSLASRYLSKDYSINLPTKNELSFGLSLKNATANNLKGIDVDLPVNGITVFSGVSGSGKSSLLFDVIAQSGKYKKAINCDSIHGLDKFQTIIKMDQTAIGNNPNSTPMTYLGLFDEIRELFAETDEAKNQKIKKTHFSFNSKGGRCEHCKGQGQIKVSMDFLADVWTTCPECEGKRYTKEILNVKWQGNSIFEVLEITVSQALNLFDGENSLKESLGLLVELGLGHLKLGQASNTLSGGESQRIKLAKELLSKTKGKTLYILDEPTTGLHFYDVEKLIGVLNKIAQKGHAVYIIEHHPWMIKFADYNIELGPKGGEEGGYLITKNQISKYK